MALTLKLNWAKQIELTVTDPTDNPIVSVDFDGNTLSRLSDDNWIFPVSRSRPRDRFTVYWPSNAKDAKKLALLRLTHGKALGATAAGGVCRTVAELAEFCSYRGIEISNLRRHPQVVIDFCAQSAQGKEKPSSNRISKTASIARIAVSANHFLGWTFLEPDQIRALENIQTLEPRQHPVIPRRIHQEIDDTAHAVLDGYLRVADELDTVLLDWTSATDAQRLKGGQSNWTSLLVAHPKLKRELSQFARTSSNVVLEYYSAIRAAAFWVIAAGSCARKSEILALRRGCLRRERIGDIEGHLLTSATTKTQANQHAIWVVSPRTSKAVQALDRVLDSYIAIHPQPPNLSDYLFQILETNFGRRVLPSQSRKGKRQFGSPTRQVPLQKLTSQADLRISHEDWAEAKQLTPDLDAEKFAPGKIWPLTSHQVRRTVLVYAAACGLVSQDSLMFQAKHETWKMTAYYCRNYWHLANSNPEDPLVAGTRRKDAEAFTRIYADTYNMARSQTLEDDRLFSPYGADHKRSIVAATPLLSEEEIQKGTAQAALKTNTLGLCAQSGYCEWQKAITVRGCMTKDKGQICSNAILDSNRLGELRALRESLTFELESLAARDSFAREQTEADITATDHAISLIEEHRNGRKEAS